MLWVISTFAVLFVISLGIIAAVALPQLRQERPQLLTPRGEELLREAKARLTNVGSRS